MKTRIFTSFGVALLAIALTFVACQKEVDQISIDDPNILGPKRLIVNTVSTDGLDGKKYSLRVTGPVNFDTTVSTREVILDGIKNGEYTLTVSKPGYLSSTKTINYKASEDPDIISYKEVIFNLNKRNNGVQIDHEKGGSFTIPAINSLYPGDITVNVPAGAIAGSGSTPISITPASLDFAMDKDKFYIVNDGAPIHLACEPSGLVFEKPIEVVFSTQNFDFNSDQGHFLTYLDKDPMTGELRSSSTGTEILEILINEEDKTATVLVPHFSFMTWTYTELFGGRWHYYRHDDRGISPWYCIDFEATQGNPKAPGQGSIVSEIFNCGPSAGNSDENRYCKNQANAFRYQISPAPSNDCCFTRVFSHQGAACGGNEYAYIRVRYPIMNTTLFSVEEIPAEDGGTPPDLNAPGVYDALKLDPARLFYEATSVDHINNNLAQTTPPLEIEPACSLNPENAAICPDPNAN